MESERLARAFLDAMVVGDAAAMEATLAEDAAMVLPRPTMSGRAFAGRENLLTALVGLNARYESPRAEYGTVLAGPDAVAVEWCLTASLVSNGAPYEQFYGWFFDIRDGRITEIREYMDTEYGLRMSDAASSGVLARHAP